MGTLFYERIFAMKPKHKHYCDQCTYLGSMFMHNKVADWYVCNDTVLARMSDEGSDYWSMPISVATDDRYLTAQDSNRTVAYTDHRVLARFMLGKHRIEQEKLDLSEALALAQLAAKLDGFKETT
jgi:hypothetical protein